MKSFSVLTVSKRVGWEPVALESMAWQLAQPDKWVIVTENPLDIPPERATVIPAPPKKRVSNLNASLNTGLRLITSDYVVFYQDFIDLMPDCFEKLLDLADEKTFVTTCTPNYDGSNDSRYIGSNDVHECPPRHWEANVAIAPMKIIRELGGFDEEYDNGWSWDNVNLAHRAFLLGCKFLIDETNRPTLLPHELGDHLNLPSNADRHAQTMEAIMHKERPLRLRYLGKRHGTQGSAKKARRV